MTSETDIAEKTQYNQLCKDEFKKLNQKSDKILAKLFIDNGGESFQSRLNRHDIWIKRMTTGLIAIALVVLPLSINGVWEAIIKIIKKP